MQAPDTYTSRLEANMRLLSQRLAWLDERSRTLASENDALRRELDLGSSQIEEEARVRAGSIVSAAEERAAALNAATAEEVERQRAVIAERARNLEAVALRRISEVRQQVEDMGSGPDMPPPVGPPVATGPPPEALAELGDHEGPGPPGPIAAAEPEGAAEPDPEQLAAAAALREEIDGLRREIEGLTRLRDALITNIRGALIGFAERLGDLERSGAGAAAAAEAPEAEEAG